MRRIIGLVLMILLGIVFSVSSLMPSAMAKPVIELSFAAHSPPQGPVEIFYQKWAKELEAETNGRIKITFYFSQSLVPGPELLPAVQRGVADMSILVSSLNPVVLQPLMVTELPGMGITDSAMGTDILLKLMDKYPQMKKCLKGVVPLWTFSAVPRTIHMIDKEIRVPKDFKGTKLYATSYVAKGVKRLGGAPIAMHPADWAMSLERKLIQGMLVSWWPAEVFKCLEALHIHNENVDLGRSTMFVIMNEKRFKSLPADIRQLLIEKYMPWGQKETVAIDMKTGAKARQKCVARGDSFIQLSQDEMDAWNDVFLPVHRQWIKDTAKRIPSQAIYDEAKALIKNYRR